MSQVGRTLKALDARKEREVAEPSAGRAAHGGVGFAGFARAGARVAPAARRIRTRRFRRARRTRRARPCVAVVDDRFGGHGVQLDVVEAGVRFDQQGIRVLDDRRRRLDVGIAQHAALPIGPAGRDRLAARGEGCPTGQHDAAEEGFCQGHGENLTLGGRDARTLGVVAWSVGLSESNQPELSSNSTRPIVPSQITQLVLTDRPSCLDNLAAFRPVAHRERPTNTSRARPTDVPRLRPFEEPSHDPLPIARRLALAAGGPRRRVPVAVPCRSRGLGRRLARRGRGRPGRQRRRKSRRGRGHRRGRWARSAARRSARAWTKSRPKTAR